MRFAIIVAAALLSACGQSSKAPQRQSEAKKPAPALQTFNAAWIPKATGVGNFEICLRDDAIENDIHSARVPSGVIFQSWGAITGPLRHGDNFDHSVLGSGRSDERTQYAIVTVSGAHLTDKNPCQIVRARAAISEGFTFIHELVPASLNYSFSADSGILGTKAGIISNVEKDPLLSLTEGGYLLGAVISDVGDPVIFKDP